MNRIVRLLKIGSLFTFFSLFLVWLFCTTPDTSTFKTVNLSLDEVLCADSRGWGNGTKVAIIKDKKAIYNIMQIACHRRWLQTQLLSTTTLTASGAYDASYDQGKNIELQQIYLGKEMIYQDQYITEARFCKYIPLLTCI
ncbi:hypothetical protein [Vibrio parahaemolyticus]|uniref:hypothetical protein n=1 Tax=Vibrio parahaemolyticus TaxID=670 RepID=UPI00215C0FA5|nr:hypothetical protein [Vibrio parahaemolyticus]MCR9832557.1 hypothetical protein [Vibrio parahaemolyticus]